MESLDADFVLLLENQEINDYLQEGDVGFKKPKVSLACPLRPYCTKF